MNPIQIFIVVFVLSKEIAAQEIKRSTGCVENRLTLECGQWEYIQIKSVLLGDSDCYRTNCCPKLGTDCQKPSSYEHKIDVTKKCNGQRRCEIAVEKMSIYCSLGPNNDYEVIHYECILRTTPSTQRTHSSVSFGTTPTIRDFTRLLLVPISTPYVLRNESTPGTFPHSTTPIIPEMTPVTSEFRFTDPKKDLQDYEDVVKVAPWNANRDQDGTNVQKIKLENMESIVIPVTVGLILITLIISIACLVFKKSKLRSKAGASHENNLSGIYLHPITYQTLNRAYDDNQRPTPYQLETSCCGNQFETYDSIREVCSSLDDGYLKPADVVIQSCSHNYQQQEEEETRYVMN